MFTGLPPPVNRVDGQRAILMVLEGAGPSPGRQAVSGVTDPVFYISNEHGEIKRHGKLYPSIVEAGYAAEDERWSVDSQYVVVQKFDPATGIETEVFRIPAAITIYTVKTCQPV